MENEKTEKLVELVADFLYDWEDTGESPSKVARRLLAIIGRVEAVQEPLREGVKGLD